MLHAWWAIAACLLLGTSVCSTVQAGTVRLEGAGGAFNIPVQSRKEVKWATVVRQQYDYSCGAAAVATLLSFHYDRRIGEVEVFRAMFEKGNKEQIQTAGFSMLDMKLYLDAKELRADGFGMTLDKFAKIGVPGITMIDTNGYKHFVVVKGIEGNRVLVADPALGTRVLPRKTFEQQWNGAVLAARESIQIARQHFNEDREWRVRPKALLGEGVDRTGLGALTLSLPGLQEFGR